MQDSTTRAARAMRRQPAFSGWPAQTETAAVWNSPRAAGVRIMACTRMARWKDLQPAVNDERTRSVPSAERSEPPHTGLG